MDPVVLMLNGTSASASFFEIHIYQFRSFFLSFTFVSLRLVSHIALANLEIASAVLEK